MTKIYTKTTGRCFEETETKEVTKEITHDIDDLKIRKANLEENLVKVNELLAEADKLGIPLEKPVVVE